MYFAFKISSIVQSSKLKIFLWQFAGPGVCGDDSLVGDPVLVDLHQGGDGGLALGCLLPANQDPGSTQSKVICYRTVQNWKIAHEEVS